MKDIQLLKLSVDFYFFSITDERAEQIKAKVRNDCMQGQGAGQSPTTGGRGGRKTARTGYRRKAIQSFISRLIRLYEGA